MNDNIEFNNDNIDIFSIIEKILNKKIVVFTFVFIGTLFGYLFFNNQEKSYNNILKFDLKEISNLEKKIIYSSSFMDFGLALFLTPELQNFSNSTYLINSFSFLSLGFSFNGISFIFLRSLYINLIKLICFDLQKIFK